HAPDTGCSQAAGTRGRLSRVRTRRALLPHHPGLTGDAQMLLTRKQVAAPDTNRGSAAVGSSFVEGLQRGIARALPTMDRRTFLRRSGIGVGAGVAASGVSLVQPAAAADVSKAGLGRNKVSVKRTVCTHCSV